MQIFKTVQALQLYLEMKRSQGKTIGFVPTMGALHEGHMSLIRLSKESSDITLCSIFVNPTQFNVASDLDKYPRTLEADAAMLMSEKCDAIFLPSVEEIYPSSQNTTVEIDFGELDKVMEGEHRPGHFAGVAQVLTRFLDIIHADAMYMGQKDFQQFSIVKEMLRQSDFKTQLVMAETVREKDGLAMSSRNVRLTEKERQIAPLISKVLFAAKEKVAQKSVAQIKEEALTQLNIPEFTMDYFEIADGNTLQPIDSFEGVEIAVACTAIFLGDVRLIDNVVLVD